MTDRRARAPRRRHVLALAESGGHRDARPDAEAQRLARRVREGIARRLARVEKAAARVHSGAASEDVHDLRVSARRLEAALRLWRPLLAGRPARRARRRARALRRAFSPVREMELHLALLRSPALVAGSDPARAGAEWLARRLERRHERRLASPPSRVRPRSVRAIGESVARAIRGMTRRAESAGDPLRAVRARLEERERAITAGLSEAIQGGDAALHALRLRVKEARYALESLGEAIDVPFRLDRLRELQDVLGEIHDHAELMDRVRTRVARAMARGAAPRAANLEALLTRLESAYAERRSRLERLADAGPPGPDPPPALKSAEEQAG